MRQKLVVHVALALVVVKVGSEMRFTLYSLVSWWQSTVKWCHLQWNEARQAIAKDSIPAQKFWLSYFVIRNELAASTYDYNKGMVQNHLINCYEA